MRTVHSVLAVYALLACSTFASAQTSFRQTLPIKASGREASVKQLEATIRGQGAYMTTEALPAGMMTAEFADGRQVQVAPGRAGALILTCIDVRGGQAPRLCRTIQKAYGR